MLQTCGYYSGSRVGGVLQEGAGRSLGVLPACLRLKDFDTVAPTAQHCRLELPPSLLHARRYSDTRVVSGPCVHGDVIERAVADHDVVVRLMGALP